MRSIFICASLFLILASAAGAETRIFVLDSDDGYGVNRCLVTGATCGATVASAYCRSQDFAEARSFRKLAQAGLDDGPTVVDTCRGRCGERVAIECTR
jgi:hypothetical protein